MKFTRNPSRNGSTNFSGTLTSESEVVWWERLTRCYLAYTEPKDLSFKQKQAAFKVLFNLGMGNDLSDLSAELACLPVGAREEVLGPYQKLVPRWGLSSRCTLDIKPRSPRCDRSRSRLHRT